MRKILFLPLLAAFLIPAACSKKPPASKFCMIGSEEFNAPADAWNAEYTEKNMIHEGRGNGTALSALLEDACSMAALTRPMKDEEIHRLKEQTGHLPAAVPIGIEALAVIASPDYSENSVEEEMLRRIYLDEDRENPVAIYGVNSASERFRFFRDTLLGGKQVADRILEMPGPLALVDRIAQEKSALGYARPAEADGRVKILEIKKDGVIFKADDQSIREGIYPYSRYYYIYIRGGKKPDADTIRFMNLVLSEKGQKMLYAYGLYPLSEKDRQKSLEILNGL